MWDARMHVHEVGLGKDSNVSTDERSEPGVSDAKRFKERVESATPVEMLTIFQGENVYRRAGGDFHQIGTVIRQTFDALWLCPCTWVADSGRFRTALESGQFDDVAELEPFPDDVVVRVPLSEVSHWPHPVPRESR